MPPPQGLRPCNPVPHSGESRRLSITQPQDRADCLLRYPIWGSYGQAIEHRPHGLPQHFESIQLANGCKRMC
jgi:hypothetical protein